MPTAADVTVQLLASRATGGTICPSEVARAVATDGDWRAAMPSVHMAVDDLLSDGKIVLSWKGRLLNHRQGPYRIGLGTGNSS